MKNCLQCDYCHGNGWRYRPRSFTWGYPRLEAYQCPDCLGTGVVTFYIKDLLKHLLFLVVDKLVFILLVVRNKSPGKYFLNP